MFIYQYQPFKISGLKMTRSSSNQMVKSKINQMQNLEIFNYNEIQKQDARITQGNNLIDVYRRKTILFTAYDIECVYDYLIYKCDRAYTQFFLSRIYFSMESRFVYFYGYNKLRLLLFIFLMISIEAFYKLFMNIFSNLYHTFW